MFMNEMEDLERTFQRIRDLPPGERNRYGVLLATCWRETTRPPATWRTRTTGPLSRVRWPMLKKTRAGRYRPLDEVFDELREELRERHGVRRGHLCEEIDERVGAFPDRPIEGDWPYPWIGSLSRRHLREGPAERSDRLGRRHHSRHHP